MRVRLDAVEDKRMAILDEIYKLRPGVTIIDSECVRDNMHVERERLRDPVIMEGWGQMRVCRTGSKTTRGFGQRCGRS